MNFLHKREYLNAGDVAVVSCSHQCNVLLLDDSNFSQYQRGGRYQYLGGHYERLPARIGAPHSGQWNIVIDLGGGSASIRHSIEVLRAA